MCWSVKRRWTWFHELRKRTEEKKYLPINCQHVHEPGDERKRDLQEGLPKERKEKGGHSKRGKKRGKNCRKEERNENPELQPVEQRDLIVHYGDAARKENPGRRKKPRIKKGESPCVQPWSWRG